MTNSVEQSVVERIRAALEGLSHPERWDTDVAWHVDEANNECWAIGQVHLAAGTANLAKADAAYIRTVQPLHMREVLALIQSQAYELGRRDDVLQWIKQNPSAHPANIIAVIDALAHQPAKE